MAFSYLSSLSIKRQISSSIGLLTGAGWMLRWMGCGGGGYMIISSPARTRVELEQRHQAFIHTCNTTAHQGLLKDRRLPSTP
jgi:hypothetical protein